MHRWTPARLRLTVLAALSLNVLAASLLPLSTGPGRATAADPEPGGLSRPVDALVSELVHEQRAAGLRCHLTAAGTPSCFHGVDDVPAASDAAHGEAPTDAPADSDAPLACLGDGQSGPRVRTVYARPQGSPDRYAAMLPSFQRWAVGVDRQVDQSARRTQGRRHVRFATTAGPDCRLAVARVTLPADAFATFPATIDALQQRGYGQDSSKYLVWADTSGFCGVATTFADDSPALSNVNNRGYPGFARIDRRCWGAVEAHELVHLLGGVQPTARNATDGFHCTDGHDVMCYDDGAGGGAQRSVCSSDRAAVLDCRNDDYFSTAAPRGSYLQTHWNTARSSFLWDGGPGGGQASAAES